MAARELIVVGLLLVTSCSGVRSVQLQPPVPTPPGLVWGYGVEKVRQQPDVSRQSAYLKAIDDLLTRGPLLVSKTVEDNTTVVNLKSSTRTMASRFRLRASLMLQPSFVDSGLQDGFVWVLLGTTEEDIERGWLQFVEWRGQKIEQARSLFQTAGTAQDPLPILKASLSLLEEAGVADDPILLYYEVKTAFDAEQARIVELESLQKKFRTLTDSGELAAADTALDRALRLGLDPMLYNQFKMEVMDRRKQANHLMLAGDDLFRDEQYKEALDRYQRSQRLDRDNPQLPSKLAMADRYHRNARSHTLRSTVGMVGWGATRVLGEYFEYKREQEERKRIEAEQAAEEERNESRREGRRRRTEDRREPEAGEPKRPPEQTKGEEPIVEDPKIEDPKIEEPEVERPGVEEPKVDKPKVEEPPTDTPRREDPKIDPKSRPKPENKETDTPLERIRPKKKIG